MDDRGYHLVNTCYFVPSDSYALLAMLNSTPVNWYYQFVTSEYRGGYQRSFTHAIKNLPIPTEIVNSDSNERLAKLAEDMSSARLQRKELNLSLLDYIAPYQDGPKLAELDGYQPAPGRSGTVLAETTETRDNLRLGSVRTETSESKLTIEATARYKPEENQDKETDQWGYTETDYVPVMEFIGLDELQQTLTTAFLQTAVEKSEGFANFRETATKKLSLIDRLKALEMPAMNDVEDGLKRYMEQVDQAERLDGEIERIHSEIDSIVCNLFDLDEKDIQTIEQSLAE